MPTLEKILATSVPLVLLKNLLGVNSPIGTAQGANWSLQEQGGIGGDHTLTFEDGSDLKASKL